MIPGSDPYRTLGLDPGATPAEVKRAYRRLAKANHPDSAGEQALPRFLAIQAAYERLTEGQPGSSRAARRPTDGRSANEGPAAPPPGRSWRADAERARATREAYRRRGGRANPPGAAAGAGPAPGRAAPGMGTPPGSTGSTGRSSAGRGPGPAAEAGPATGDRSSRPAGRRSRAKPKATIGSTSYDGTENEPFEPGWTGATWYGAGSGTYWTINPKEYADPRKHGPEYLARARRARRNAPAEAGEEPVPADPVAEDLGRTGSAIDANGPESTSAQPDGSNAAASPAAGASSTGASSAASRAGLGSAAASGAAVSQGTTQSTSAVPGDLPDARRAAPNLVPPPSTAQSLRRPIDLGPLDPTRISRSWRGRVALAAVAWFPLGLAIFGVHGQLTGCAEYLARCTQPIAWSVWIPQLIVFGLLLLSPRLAWIAASGSVVLLVVAVPLAGGMTSVSAGRPSSGATTELLLGAMSLGWLAGVAIALSGRIPLPPWRSRTMGG